MKKTVCVVMGGPSAEYEVSLKSGCEVLRYIDKDKYRVRAVVVDKNKTLFYADVDGDGVPSPEVLFNPHVAKRMKGPFHPADAKAVWERCDVAFLALHGTFGEDGMIQGYLESIGVPYTGSDVYASAVAMNKIASKFLYMQNGIDVPPYAIYASRFPENTLEKIAVAIGFPCFVKCPQSGSSRLMGRAENRDELAALVAEYVPQAAEILIEKAINGPEFTCGVLDDEKGIASALPPVEIRPKAVYFTYDAKYTDGASEDIVPAPQSQQVLTQIQETALSAHRALGCRGISRTDMIMSDGKLYVLETNTLPGLTAQSLIPLSYKALGGTFTGLIDLLIKQALRAYGKETV